MSIELKDGTFTDPEPLEKAIEKFRVLAGTEAVALHAGTVEELKAKQQEKELKDRVKELEQKMVELTGVKSKVLFMPTRDEIERFGRLKNE